VWKPEQLLLDTTVPLAATSEPATRVLGGLQGSAAEQTQELLPAGVSWAAAFQNLWAEILAGDEPVDCDVLVCAMMRRQRQVASDWLARFPGASVEWREAGRTRASWNR